ncbi:hypothetical protein CI109_101143 [Kwoniella shandongensis]|uniref:Uncharacterized protein n=1 Tax=Kwoniella shandongensis TaxID=1734106 RepID=A0A5M6C9X3_9TREE|nr:uncharacterized protein CI109_001612 [Kwoniella shandongensis]KAA5530205.1 hypothetical protein CI109_001612 [Kwoniella shandongensis]
MPPFTSTSITTLVRKVASVAKHIHPPAKATMSRTAPNRTINTLHRTRNAIHQLAHQTFPSLATPAHQLHNSGQSLRVGARGFASQPPIAATKTARRLLGPVGRAIQASGKRPKWTHGPSIPANVGLGLARGFASGPAAGVHGKVPMGLRAFASLLDDDNNGKPLPRPSRYSPYARPSRTRRHRRSQCSVDSSLIKDMKHYFPLVVPHQTEVIVTLPPLPETLITPGSTAVLALPLAPSLDALLNPTPTLSYSQTSIGVHIFARLTDGLLPIHSALSLHASTRIIPLLTKLDGLGVLDYHPASPKVKLEVVTDAEGRPDILRLIFEDRSVGNVRELLGESLRETEQGQWWAWYEEKRGLELTQGERKEMMEQWGSTDEQPRQPLRESVEELVFPTLDMSTYIDSDDSALIDSMSSSVPTSWPTSGSSTPSELISRTPSLPSTPSEDGSLTESLLSRLAESNSDIIWSVYPSDSDSDVESAIAVSEEWGEVSSISVLDDNEQEQSESVLGRWTGSGEGFGFLAQPW